MEVGGRTIEGVLLERGQAREHYADALRTGHRAAMAEQERPDVFTLSVGNLQAGEVAKVHLTLAGLLPCIDGEVTFRFPLVVAPRYVSGIPLSGSQVGHGTALDTEAAPDASRVTTPVLLPGPESPGALSLTVEVASAGFELLDLRTSLDCVAEGIDGGGCRIRLRPGHRLDRDFVLRFLLAGDSTRTSLCFTQDQHTPGEGTFLLTVVPPPARGGLRRPRTVAFLLDCSGSMAGWKIVAARRAMARMIDTLRPDDRFALVTFNDRTHTPPGIAPFTLLPATDRHRFQAVEYVARRQADGGTELLAALEPTLAALSADASPDRVAVLVTDGQVANEAQIVQTCGTALAGTRLLVVGIDMAANAGLLERLARLGRGHCELVESEDRLDEALARLHRHLDAPVLTGLKLEANGLRMDPPSLVPAPLPDLFASTPLVVAGRYHGLPEGTVALSGTASDGQPWREAADARVVAASAPPAVWARAHLAHLEDRFDLGREDLDSLERQIVEVSLRFGVLCRFTAYVAVDRSAPAVEGGLPYRVVQPVEWPAGWEAPEATLGSVSFCTGMLAEPRAAYSPAPVEATGTEGPPRRWWSTGDHRGRPLPEGSRRNEIPAALRSLLDELGHLRDRGLLPEEGRAFVERLRVRLVELIDAARLVGLEEEVTDGLGHLAQRLEELERQLGSVASMAWEILGIAKAVGDAMRR